MISAPSPIQTINYLNRSFFVKRDDLLHPFINGNKARKLLFLINKNPMEYDELVSCGGSQSNAMYALAHLAKMNKWKFTYYCPHLPEWLKDEPIGNLKSALDNGMILHELGHAQYKTFRDELINITSETGVERVLRVPMGGQCVEAEEGILSLANELLRHIKDLNLSDVDIVLSSGTGTTSLYLARDLPHMRIFTVPCVYGKEYLEKQISSISNIPKNLFIMEPPLKIPFARPHIQLYEVYRDLKNIGIEFDLIYDATVWLYIKNNLSTFQNRKLIFIHSGGIHGNESQLKRYKQLSG